MGEEDLCIYLHRLIISSLSPSPLSLSSFYHSPPSLSLVLASSLHLLVPLPLRDKTDTTTSRPLRPALSLRRASLSPLSEDERYSLANHTRNYTRPVFDQSVFCCSVAKIRRYYFRYSVGQVGLSLFVFLVRRSLVRDGVPVRRDPTKKVTN